LEVAKDRIPEMIKKYIKKRINPYVSIKEGFVQPPGVKIPK